MKRLLFTLALAITSTISADIKEATNAAEFNMLINQNDIVLVDMYASWCGPCRRMIPILQKLSNSRPQITILKVSTEKVRAIAQRYSIKSIPAFLLFKNGTLVKKIVGAQSLSKMQQLVDSV